MMAAISSGISVNTCQPGSRGGTVGRSRDRFPVVSLEFFIDIILPATLTQLLTEMSTSNISGGVKAAGA